jgi:hypothetical protein
MRYIKLFENWTHSQKVKDLVIECEEILRELEFKGIDIIVEPYYDEEGYFDIKIELEPFFELSDISERVKHLIYYLYEDENIGLHAVLTFSPDRENGRPIEKSKGNITKNGDTLTSDRYKFNADINNENNFFDKLKDIKYQFIKLYFRKNFTDE